MIRTEEERAFFGQILEAAHFEMKAVEREKINQTPQQKERNVSENIEVGQCEHLRIGHRLAQDCRPCRLGSSGLALAPPRARKNGIDQVAHRINLRQLRLGHFAAQLLLECGQQFNALHGVESQIKLQIVSGMNRVELAARGLPHDGEGALHIIPLQPQLVVGG